MTDIVDILIVGAGIVGIATALEMQTREPNARITVIEKEANPAAHQSGHNSGVIHAGVYYKPGSMKAKFCRDGVTATIDFCTEHGIPVKQCGKLIVATDAAELTRLQNLGTRARENGILIEDVDQAQLSRMEPNINGVAALYSPTTGITDYKQVTEVMAKLFTTRGGVIRYNEPVIRGRETDSLVTITTNRGTIEADRVFTCTGLHSDRTIRAFGQDPGYQVVPFRGEYFQLLNQPDDLVNHLIYPVPDPERPFLGIHLTRKIHGGFTVGPNAVLAFKREGYNLTDFSMKDVAGTLGFSGFWKMLAQNAGPAVSELVGSMSRRTYLTRIHKYCSNIKLTDLAPYPAGVRAQAVAPDGKIIDDFLFVQTPRCLHVGNAPSPAATSAIPIATYVANQFSAAD